MDNTLPQTVGIDISKATLDVYAHPAGRERQFTNTATHGEIRDSLSNLNDTACCFKSQAAGKHEWSDSLSLHHVEIIDPDRFMFDPCYSRTKTCELASCQP